MHQTFRLTFKDLKDFSVEKSRSEKGKETNIHKINQHKSTL